MTTDTPLDVMERLAGRSATCADVGPTATGVRIFAAWWQAFPEPGMITGFTVGLSAHPRFRGAVAPELIISVESDDPAWVLAIGEVARLAGDGFSFDPWETVDFRAQVSDTSPMTAFLLADQMVLPSEYDQLPTSRGPVALRQMVPLHSSELAYIRKNGPGAFVEQAPDPSSVLRPPIF